MALSTYIDAINSALHEEMARDENVYIIGEDVGVMGGAFKATKGLIEEYGADRVMDSPLAEGIIVSSCIGAAMSGLRPVAEIQFSDFITPAMDALVEQAAVYVTVAASKVAFTTPRPTRHGSRTNLGWL